MKRILILTLLVCLMGLAPDRAHAQTAEGRFVTVHHRDADGIDGLRVTLELRAPEAAFDLGNAALMLVYDPDVLRFRGEATANAPLVQARDYRFHRPFVLDPGQQAFYDNTVTVFGAPGRLSVNLVLRLAGLGQPLGEDFTPVVDLLFDVAERGQPPGLAWVVGDDANPTVLFLDDNRTPVALGAFSGQEAAAPVATEADAVPSTLTLAAAYPNPFNPHTTLRYALPAAGPVRLALFDVLGRQVATLVDEAQPMGWHTVTWEAGAYASGLYLARLESGPAVEVRTLMLIK